MPTPNYSLFFSTWHCKSCKSFTNIRNSQFSFAIFLSPSLSVQKKACPIFLVAHKISSFTRLFCTIIMSRFDFLCSFIIFYGRKFVMQCNFSLFWWFGWCGTVHVLDWSLLLVSDFRPLFHCDSCQVCSSNRQCGKGLTLSDFFSAFVWLLTALVELLYLFVAFNFFKKFKFVLENSAFSCVHSFAISLPIWTIIFTFPSHMQNISWNIHVLPKQFFFIYSFSLYSKIIASLIVASLHACHTHRKAYLCNR